MNNINKPFKKKEIINELKELKNMIEYIETMTENEHYKPLEQTEIELLEHKPTADCIKEAHLYIIVEKIKKIIEQNKDKLSINFKTIVTKDKISINYVENLKTFNAITLNLEKQPPVIESTIYDISELNQDIKILETKIKEINKTIDKLKDVIEKENINLGKLKKTKENYKSEDKLEQTLPKSKLDKQEIKIDLLKYEIRNLWCKLKKYKERKIKLEELEQIALNFKDFEKLRKILKETLGINLESKTTKKDLIIEQSEPKEKSNNYIIGNKYAVKYIQKTKKLI